MTNTTPRLLVIFSILLISPSTLPQPTTPTSNSQSQQSNPLFRRSDISKMKSFIIYSKCFYSFKRKLSTFINSMNQNNLTLMGANQFAKDIIGYKKELDSCKYIDRTIGLGKGQGCFTSMVNNYNNIQDQLNQNSKVVDHYLQLYNSLGNPKRLKLTVEGFKYDNNAINLIGSDNSFLIRKDNEEKLKEIAQRIKKRQARRAKQKQKEAEKKKKKKESEKSNKEKKSHKTKKPKISTQEEILASLSKFEADFNSKCKNNDSLRLQNPKCYTFFQNKFSRLSFNPKGVQIIEYYMFLSTLRRMLTLEMWNEMYDTCVVNQNYLNLKINPNY